MKMIYKIAGAEFRNLFYSPIAWLILLVFYIVCGFQFVDPLVDAARIQEANLENNPAWPGFPMAVSVGIFVKSLKNVLENLYLFIPLLTMGVINREVNAGTMKLLYSSPIRVRDIVLGKYLGLLVFSCLLLTMVAVLFATGYFTIIHAEVKWYLAILLAFFLLSGAFIAIGLFISSVTQYQVVAGILTFVVFFVLQGLQEVWQQYDFFRDITYFLAMTNKAEQMIGGLITTRDVLYFILIIAMFLVFTLIKLKSTQESKSWKVSFLRYVLVSLLTLTVGYFSSRPGYVGYLDVTRGKLNTIHPAMQAALKELDGSPLTITLYTNVLGRGAMDGLPQNRNKYIWQYWEKFVEFYPHIRYQFEYYYDVNDQSKEIMTNFPGKSVEEAAAIMAELFDADIKRFKKPEQIRKLVNLQAEDLGLIMELEYKGKKEFLRTYPDTKVFPEQIHVAGTIRRLARPANPTIYFTTGHYERSPFRNGEREYGHNTNYKQSRFALINMGVDVDTLSLLQHDIPANTAILVVADPKAALDTVERKKIIDYIDKGGNAILYGEPGKQDMLNPLLQSIGVTLDEGTIVIPSKHDLPQSFTPSVTKTGIHMAGEEPLNRAVQKGTPAGIYLYGGATISFQSINGFTVEPIYDVTPAHDGWIEQGVFTGDSAAPVFSAAAGDVRKNAFVIGVQLKRKIAGKEQRIMISGDADFMTPRRVYGGDIRNGMFSWVLYNDYPVYTNYADPLDVKVKLGFDASRMIYLVYVYIIPAIVLAGATLLLIRRKRK
jgi:ABC-2 type transport system permease protein